MKRTVVIDTVALTPRLFETDMTNIRSFAEKGQTALIKPILPALTCPIQTTYLTGGLPKEHGIVGNGWYFRDEGEIKFWRQSNRLVQLPKIWEKARILDPSFTCANLFWWYNMYSSVNYSVTPRPMYPADGRKISDIYTNPPELRHFLQRKLGQFPLFHFWGPASSIKSSRWIAEASILVNKIYHPTLTLIYLPHLDYGLQKFALDKTKINEWTRELDEVCGKLIDYYTTEKCQILLLSEYGIMPVSKPIHINRILRQHGFLETREELDHELLDPGRSAAFAVTDHQIAHIYLNKPSALPEIYHLLKKTKGIAEVFDIIKKREFRLDHERSGELIALADHDAWFTYYYWLEDQHAPDFARTVDIHRKPGYDPMELFLDPAIKFPKISIGWKMLKNKLGLRTLFDVIPLSAELVRGSHGQMPQSQLDYPLFITQNKEIPLPEIIEAQEVYDLILKHLTA